MGEGEMIWACIFFCGNTEAAEGILPNTYTLISLFLEQTAMNI